MLSETDEAVESLGLRLVSLLAPDELPLYPSMVSQFQDTKRGGRRKASKASSEDQILGFGVGEAVTLLTPVILSFSRSFWEALVSQVAQNTLHVMLDYVKAHRPGDHATAPDPPLLTADQLQLIRLVAQQEASRLNLPEGQAAVLADAMVGVLTAPPAT